MNYATHYDLLIDRARGRILEGYRERHHVLPRCMGGGDELENIVELTPEEHFVAHQLLVKMHPDVRGLAYATVFMAQQCTGNKAYGWLRRRLAATLLGQKRGPHSSETRAKISVAHLGMKNSTECRSKLSAAMRGKKPFLGKKHSVEARAKIRAVRVLQIITPEHRAKISAAMRGNQNTLGHVLSAEHRAKLSAASMGRRHSPETRAKLSAQHRGMTHTVMARAKMSAARKGKPWSVARRQAAIGCSVGTAAAGAV